jgi:hypothetical protein
VGNTGKDFEVERDGLFGGEAADAPEETTETEEEDEEEDEEAEEEEA